MIEITLPGLTFEESQQVLPSGVILLGYVGSVAHGTRIPKVNPDSIDDIDLMGISVAPENVYLGLGKFEQKEVKYKEYDSVVYEIKKFFNLLLKQNPNVLGLLWLQDQNYLIKSLSGRIILDNRNLFISKQAYHSFVGYAGGQLHRMEHAACKGYMGEKRKQLVAKFGYDTKNAAHLIRLLRMGIEFLNDGELKVFRSDADELKEIKQGKWTLKEIKQEADYLFKVAQKAFNNSQLPEKPNYEKAEELLISILQEHLR